MYDKIDSLYVFVVQIRCKDTTKIAHLQIKVIKYYHFMHFAHRSDNILVFLWIFAPFSW